MPSTCLFEFDRPEPIYYSGETVNGRIRLQTTSEKSCREVYILFEGEAKVRWEERRSRQVNGKTQYYTEYFRGNESYIHSKTPVFPEGTLPPGIHEYTFSIPIPPQSPSSCVEKYGQISYEVSLTINRPWRFDNVFRHPLTVLKQLNLNLNPEFLIPLNGEDIKHFCCWPCSSGPVISTLNIPFGGYAPGQNIKYSLLVDNQSAKYDLDGIKMKFIQTYHFTAHSPRHKTRTHSITLAEVAQDSPVIRMTKKILEGKLLIPPAPPSSDPGGILRVDYHVEMSVKTGDCHTDSEILIPITIGTVPLMQSATNPENIALIMPSAPTPGTPGYDPDLPPSYDLIKPPSFAAATSIEDSFIDSDVDARNRIEGFIPKYPMYTNFALPTAPAGSETAPIENGTYPIDAPVSMRMPPYPVRDFVPNTNDTPSAPLLGPPPPGHQSRTYNNSSENLTYPIDDPVTPTAPAYPAGDQASSSRSPSGASTSKTDGRVGWDV